MHGIRNIFIDLYYTGHNGSDTLHLGTVQKTLCGQKIDSNWYFLGSVYKEYIKVTCRKCTKIKYK